MSGEGTSVNCLAVWAGEVDEIVASAAHVLVFYVKEIDSFCLGNSYGIFVWIGDRNRPSVIYFW